MTTGAKKLDQVMMLVLALVMVMVMVMVHRSLEGT